MRFAFPIALWLLPLALLPLLARRTKPRRRVPVAAMQFWQAAAAREATPVARRLRRHWLAIVQSAVVALIALALARPWWPSNAGAAAVVVDNSLSMSARQGGDSRLVLAARRAAEWAAGLPAETRIRLVTTSPAPRQVGEYSARGGALERALDAVHPTDAGGPLASAVAFARAGDPPPGRVLVVTDAAPPERSATEWTTVGAPADNAAIVTLGARRAHATALDADVIAHVWNYGAQALSTTLTLTYQGRVVLRQPLTIPPRSGSSASAVVRDAGLLTATIDNTDAIAADNVRSAVVAPPLAVRVALTGPADTGGFLERALGSRQGVEIVADADTADVVVCAGCAVGSAASAPAGAGVLVVPPPASTSAPAALSSVAARNGLHMPPGLDGIEAVAIAGQEPVGDTVMVRAGPQPALVASDAGGRRVVELRLDLAKSPLVLTPAFPMLVADVIDWLAGRDLRNATFDAGDPAVLRQPREDRGAVTVTGPSGAAVDAVADGGRLTITATGTAGVYHVRRAASEAPFVVNPVTSGESDLGAATTSAMAVEPTAPRDATARTDLTALLLAAALGLIAVERRMRPGPWRSQRTAAAAVLAVAFAAPRVPWGEAPRAIVFALDVSDSMDARRAEALAFLRSATAGMRRTDRSGLVVFGAGAAVERPLDAAALAGAAPTARIAGRATNLEEGLRAARAGLPADGSGRIVLVSDGRETAGQARNEAVAARAAGIPIDVMAPRAGRAVARPIVTRLVAPPTVHQHETFELRATVEGAPGRQVSLEIDGGGEPVRQTLTLPASGTATAVATIRAIQSGFSVYRASIGDADALGDFAGATAGAVVAVEGDSQLLHISDGATVVAPAGYRLARAAPAQAPRTVTALAGFDVVVLDDVEPERLDEAQRRALAQHVEQGGGLFVLGGPRSLAAPDGSDPLDRVLPVDLRPRRGQRAPGLALVIVFDKSGSMDDRIDGAPKIEFARQAVERVLASLPPTDAVGVIAFDAEALDVAPLRPGHAGAALTERLGRVRPSGGTAIGPAVERAVGWLREADAGAYARRLVLLVSDGRTSPADQARARAALTAPGIDVSTVALGDEADRRFLGELASNGNGRAFYPRRLSELPALAAREAVRVSGGHVVEERFRVQASRHAVLAGLDTGSMPTLGGYVVATARPGAETALRSPLGDPVLALWRHGLGKVAVYTADLHSPWSAGLRAWRDGAALLAQTTRWVSRRVDHPFLHTQIAERNGRLALTVEARGDGGSFLNLLDVRAQARTPAGATEDVTLTPTGPGLYDASVPVDEAGPYLFAITATSRDGQLDARVQRGFYWTAAQERAGDVDAPRLGELARVSGGRELQAGDDPFAGPRARDRRDPRPWLASLALLLFLVDVLGSSAARLWTRSSIDTPRQEAA